MIKILNHVSVCVDAEQQLLNLAFTLVIVCEPEASLGLSNMMCV